jgi:hypothetical protein
MDLARRPLSDTMASSKKRDRFNAQSLGMPLNDKVKEVRQLRPNPTFEHPFPTLLALYRPQPWANKSKPCFGRFCYSSISF